MSPYKSDLLLLGIATVALFLSRHWFESSMALHMAVQIPLLAGLGGLLLHRLCRRYSGLRQWGQRYRSSLLLFALFTLGLWMLPRMLDAALHEPLFALGKWLSLPLAGMALLLSWQHLPFVLRGVLHIEALATVLRLGWLYLIAPQRYCVSYLIDEQQLLGYVLLAYGLVYAVALTGVVMVGRPPVVSQRRGGVSPEPATHTTTGGG
ncbi:MAG: hypothetical protein R6X06_02470 [Gammaproteobacteria bacterium]